MSAPRYFVPGLKKLSLGQAVMPTWHCTKQPHTLRSIDFHPCAGTFSAQDMVVLAMPLLRTVILRAQKAGRAYGTEGNENESPERDGQVLIDGLAAVLSTSGQQSSLPLASLAAHDSPDSARRELAGQAERIGKKIISWARTILDTADPEADATYELYSSCDGHLWTQEVQQVVQGYRGGKHLMHLYNEWMHRMVMLRDAMLPFENFEDVPLVFHEEDRTVKARGLRAFEGPRQTLLTRLLTGQVGQTDLVEAAKTFTARTFAHGQMPAPGTYGFQYSDGVVLPAFLSGSKSSYLLRWHPAKIDPSRDNVLFECEHSSYYKAERSALPGPEGTVSVWPPTDVSLPEPIAENASIEVLPGRNDKTASLSLKFDLASVNSEATSYSVDIGQIARGYRYSYAPRVSKAETGNGANGTGTGNKKATLYLRTAGSALALPGLVTPGSSDASQQVHLFPAKDRLVALALLGKLYPENVVLLTSEQSPQDALGTGKGFSARLVILQ